MLFMVLCPGTPKGSTGSGSGLQGSQKTGQRLKVSSDRLGVLPGWIKICVGFITGTPEGSPKVVFMEKPGIEPATPGLQGIALIHYTTAASLTWVVGVSPNLITWVVGIYRFAKLKKNGLHLSLNIKTVTTNSM